MKKTIDFINEFICEMKKEYSDLTLSYTYDSEEDFYEIWHDNYDLQNNDDFLEVVGRKLRDIIYNNDIYNISLGYDFEKSELLGTNEFKYLSLNNGLSIDSINVNISVVSNEEMKDEDRNKGFILDKYLNNTTYPYYFEKGLVVA